MKINKKNFVDTHLETLETYEYTYYYGFVPSTTFCYLDKHRGNIYTVSKNDYEVMFQGVESDCREYFNKIKTRHD